MMERYTQQAQEALGLAVGVAESLNHGYVGTEHLLIGLLQEGTGVAAKVLEDNGVEEDRVIELVSQLIAPNPTIQTTNQTAYTPRARRVIENSYREAVRFKAAQIGTEHILIAILREGDCVASRLLNTIGVSIQKLYIDLLAAMGEDAPAVKDEIGAKGGRKGNATPTLDSYSRNLTQLAAECTAKRMVPDYISEKKMKELKVDNNGEGHCYPCMGCRSFLTPYIDEETGKPKYYGRFNQGVVTINLVDVACSSGKDMDKFWKIFDDRLELCKRALMCRHYRLKGTPSDVAPILWQNGALARLKKGETIDKLLYGGYSTISLGYAGLCECTKYMVGVTHTQPEGTEFALKVMRHLNEVCKKWAKETNIDFSLYGTPLESTTYKFAKNLQKRFGKIPGNR